MNGHEIDEEVIELVSDSPVSDTVIGLLYGGRARRVESAAQTASTDESKEVPAAPEGKPLCKSGYKSRYKPRPKRSPKQSANQNPEPGMAIARSSRSSITARAAQPVPAPESSLERHQRKCEICAHPDRDAIDEEFLHWHNPGATAYDYRIPVRSLFRHAHATGIYAQRQGNLRCVLDRVLERAEKVKLTGESVIRAVRAYTCLTPANTWVEPPTRVIYSAAPASTLDADSNEFALGDTDASRGSTKLLTVSGSISTDFGTDALNSQNLIDTPAIRK